MPQVLERRFLFGSRLREDAHEDIGCHETSGFVAKHCPEGLAEAANTCEDAHAGCYCEYNEQELAPRCAEIAECDAERRRDHSLTPEGVTSEMTLPSSSVTRRCAREA